jgi:haloalkane dehalogenase
VGGPVGWLLVGRLNLFLNVFLPGGLRRRKLTDRELLAYRGPFPPGRRGPMQVLPREIVGSRAYLHEVETNLARLSQLPALILWADSDPAFRTRERERFERLFPRHRTVILRNVGHYLEEDAPHEVAEAIADWWSEEVVDAGWPAGP